MLALRIRELRRAKKWKQRDLAREAGLSSVTVARIEAGYKHTIKQDTLSSIARALGVPVSELEAPHG
jgi:transcriptional regulator with XRE-family HTH domain